MRDKMYTIRRNEESNKLEMVTIDFPIHRSLIGKGAKIFEKVFTREYARCEYYYYRQKQDNNKASTHWIEYIQLFEDPKEFGFSTQTPAKTDISDLPIELQNLMMVYLLAYDCLIDEYTTEFDIDKMKSVYVLKRNYRDFELKDFFFQSKSIMQEMFDGKITMEVAVKKLRPYYLSACKMLDHNAEENICKKWIESSRGKNVYSFVVELYYYYHLNISGKHYYKFCILKQKYMKETMKYPLRTFRDFQKFVAWWFIIEKENVETNNQYTEGFPEIVIGKNSQKKLLTKESYDKLIETFSPKNKTRKKENINQIGFKDFVVRSNVFKCTHDKHKIDNVVAEIYIDEDGKKHLEKISAGYCPQCNIYFIMESTYENLKRRGIILCRISDHKNYMKMAYMSNGVKLAQESILMQYGYNVSQIKGLSKLRRQKILAVIIDNDVLSKSEIISYLDFFIRQRSHMSNMETAISKWEEDEEFVEHYRIGEYTKFGVNAIYRR